MFSGRQHCHLTTTPLQPFGQVPEDDFCAAADMRGVERIEE